LRDSANAKAGAAARARAPRAMPRARLRWKPAHAPAGQSGTATQAINMVNDLVQELSRGAAVSIEFTAKPVPEITQRPGMISNLRVTVGNELINPTFRQFVPLVERLGASSQ
jgi:hypothetical protein